MSLGLILLLAGVGLILYGAFRLARQADRDRRREAHDERRAAAELGLSRNGRRRVQAVSKSPPRAPRR